MVSPKTPSECGPVPSSTTILPLFREEAVAAQRQQVCGEIIRIRPFSIAFLAVLIVSLALVILCFLGWALYSRQSHFSQRATQQIISGVTR
jgi:hypothetical protein